MEYYFQHPNASGPLLVEIVREVSSKRTQVRHLTRAGTWRYIKVYTEHLIPCQASKEYMELFE